MCHYDVIYCESCNAMTQFPPVFCDKIKSGIICTKYVELDQESSNTTKLCMAMIYEKAYDVTNGELRLFDIIKANETWIDHTICSCGIVDNFFINNNFEPYTMTNYFVDDNEVYSDYYSNMGDGEWDNNGGSPQWVPST